MAGSDISRQNATLLRFSFCVLLCRKRSPQRRLRDRTGGQIGTGVSHGSRSSPGGGQAGDGGRRVEMEGRKQDREEDGFAKRSHEVWEKQGVGVYVSRVWGVCAVGVEGMSGRGAGDSVRGSPQCKGSRPF